MQLSSCLAACGGIACGPILLRLPGLALGQAEEQERWPGLQLVVGPRVALLKSGLRRRLCQVSVTWMIAK
jgi:hypothetical protein